MKKCVQKITKNLIEIFPLKIVEILLPVFALVIDREYVESRIYYRFVKRLKYNFDRDTQRIVKKGTFMEIRMGI